MPIRYGATPDDWASLDLGCGLAADLLPVISNPHAAISPQSKIKSLGKTPSTYNKNRQVIGIKNWTSHQATVHDITKWSREPDYGICIQTREVRALDLDITNPDAVAKITDFIDAHLRPHVLPLRLRSNSPKCLVAFRVAGSLPKRILKINGGIIEFLATGQQFVAFGTHPSGARYEWDWHGHNDFPTLTLEQFEVLWAALVKEFGVENPAESTLRKKGENLNISDEIVNKLQVLSWSRQGEAYITCPFKAEHTIDNGETETVYFPAGSNGYQQGHFKCLHAHCAKRTDEDFLNALGMGVANDFDIVEDELPAPVTARFPLTNADIFADGADPEWIVEDVLPQGEIAMVYGESTAGKSFFIFDMVASIALGIPWRGKDVRRGKVVYVAAEGAQGFRKRVRAYKHQNSVTFDNNLAVIDTPPSFMKSDHVDLARDILAWGKPSVIVVDTLAQTTPGADENSSEMNKALSKCKALHKDTGALVVLVHHAGKDAARGARGWSGIKAAMDAEIEITRKADKRCARITKLKDGEDGGLFPFKLLTVIVGENKKGKEITSCVVQHTDDYPTKNTGPKTKWQVIAYQTILDLCVGVDGTPVRRIIDEAVKSEPSDWPEGDKRDRRRDSAKRAISELRDMGTITIRDNLVRLKSLTAQEESLC